VACAGHRCDPIGVTFGHAVIGRVSALAVALVLLAPLASMAQEASPGPALPPILPGTTITGSIDVQYERDAYVLTIDPGEPAALLDIRLIAPRGPARRVCVEASDPTGLGSPIVLVCATGERAAILRDLLLPPGDYQVVVDGEASPDVYALG